jgi:hypothetical protein
MYHRSRLHLSALLVGATAVSIGCSSGASSGPEMPVDTQPLAEVQPFRFYSGMKTRQRLVVRDAATWANAWQQIAATMPPPPAAPAVDFSSDLLIVAAMGTMPTGGYSIDVDDVGVGGGNASISITEQSPGPTCVVTQSLTAPVVVVVVPKFAGQATFVEHTAQLACR